MRVDGRIDTGDLQRVPGIVGELERLGFDGAFAGEAAYDPFLQVAVAAEHSAHLELGTGVAVALARNPMHVAQTAHDLLAFSRGRFILGLGSQVRPHVERRFGQEWSRPADRMREFVLALKAIWRTWNERERLSFEGEFYRHTLMTPLFDPGPNPFGTPRVFMAAIGPRMAEVAGEVADGLLLHSFVTAGYVRQVVVPAVERGLSRSGRARTEFQLSAVALIVTGDDDAARAESEARMRNHLAVFGSTPAYRRVLEIEGWGELQPQLDALLKAGRSKEAGDLIADEMVDAFAFRGTPDAIPLQILDRYGDTVQRIDLRGPYGDHHAEWISALHAGSVGRLHPRSGDSSSSTASSI